MNEAPVAIVTTAERHGNAQIEMWERAISAPLTAHSSLLFSIPAVIAGTRGEWTTVLLIAGLCVTSTFYHFHSRPYCRNAPHSPASLIDNVFVYATATWLSFRFFHNALLWFGLLYAATIHHAVTPKLVDQGMCCTLHASFHVVTAACMVGVLL